VTMLQLSRLLMKHSYDFVTLDGGKTRVRRQRNEIASQFVRTGQCARSLRESWSELSKRPWIALSNS
jgi:hypothetical protein